MTLPRLTQSTFQGGNWKFQITFMITILIIILRNTVVFKCSLAAQKKRPKKVKLLLLRDPMTTS